MKDGEAARLRRLAVKWSAQARHPQRARKPGAREELERAAAELLREVTEMTGESHDGSE